MDSKKIEELANGAEKDIKILNEMFKKYAEIRYDEPVINEICFKLFCAREDLEEWVSYNKNK
jgi:hypothetical protein